jgi:hypothetical protein
METAYERVMPELRHLWQYWNLGSTRFFQKIRQFDKAALVPWHMNQEMAKREEMRAIYDTDHGGRWVPEGNYVKLLKLQRSHRNELDAPPEWETVMSDSPDEMNDHADVLLNATGKVLIHGLGLGCVLNCLLHKSDVTEIDVVEIDPQVVDLVANYYLAIARGYGKKLNIITDSCIDVQWPRNTHWNYVWHDIWSTISAMNLRQSDDPEHGISYELLHRKFQNRCDRQGSWAFNQAKKMRDIENYVEDQAGRWTMAWNWADEEERLHMLVDLQIRGMPDSFTPEKYIEFLEHPLNENGNVHLMRLKERCKSEMETDEAEAIVGEIARRYAQHKRGMLHVPAGV